MWKNLPGPDLALLPVAQNGSRTGDVERHPFGLADAIDYPLFTPDLIELMRRLLGPDQQEEGATAITVAAVRPG